jgi:hypothetical protein
MSRAYHGVEGSLVANDDELVEYYRDATSAEGKRQIVCAYCGAKHRAPFKPQREWFVTHPCAEDPAVARRNVRTIASARKRKFGGSQKPHDPGTAHWEMVLAGLQERYRTRGIDFTIDDVARYVSTPEHPVTAEQLQAWAPYIDWKLDKRVAA